MEPVDLDIGQIVRSKAGRDKGKIFVVLGRVDAKHVLIVDGSLRRVDKPKKKQTKHLAKMNLVSNEIRAAISNNEKISNGFIRKEFERLGLKP
ncbi:MAG: RNA-binding protein [Natronincolaceae bacterium]|jgi:ribosomal protein L14E/L6E/L27E|nr:KOW domain-containing RNA-binding protein [Bacillota bacterium]